MNHMFDVSGLFTGLFSNGNSSSCGCQKHNNKINPDPNYAYFKLCDLQKAIKSSNMISTDIFDIYPHVNYSYSTPGKEFYPCNHWGNSSHTLAYHLNLPRDCNECYIGISKKDCDKLNLKVHDWEDN